MQATIPIEVRFQEFFLVIRNSQPEHPEQRLAWIAAHLARPECGGSTSGKRRTKPRRRPHTEL